jgi:hypothetical protein
MTKLHDHLRRALSKCTNHLCANEVYDICARGGEGELNDLLRHALNRRIRHPEGWICQREQRRVDLVVSELPSAAGTPGRQLAAIESKFRYSTRPDRGSYMRKMLSDVDKLGAMDPTLERKFLLWSPYLSVVRRSIYYMDGHQPAEDGTYVPRWPIEYCRDAMEEILQTRSGDLDRVGVRKAEGSDGSLVLDAYVLTLDREI